MKSRIAKKLLVALVVLCAVLAGAATAAIQDACGPFTDVSPAYCPYVLQMYYLGITAGTSATTYSPDNPMTRGQAAVFLSKGVNQAIARSSRRAALGQWWTPTREGLGFTPLPERAGDVVADGADLWVVVHGSSVTRVRASDGRILETRAVAGAGSLLVALGRIFVGSNGALFMLDPATPGAVETVVSDPNISFRRMAFDGERIWVVNVGSISIVTPALTTPWSITTIPGFANAYGILFDGTNVWVTASNPNQLMRLDAAAAVIQTVALNKSPGQPIFDGSNLWVPLIIGVGSPSFVDVIQASTGTRIRTLTQANVVYPFSVAFDGRRILITALGGLSLFDAASLTLIAEMPGIVRGNLTPTAVCSDGINFWIALADTRGGPAGGAGEGGTPDIVGGLARF